MSSGKRSPAALRFVIAGVIFCMVAGIALVKIIGANRRSDTPYPTAVTDGTPPPKGPEAALPEGKPYTNPLGMTFVEAGTKRVMFCVWETRVGDFKAFVESSKHDAVSKNEYGYAALTVKKRDEAPKHVQDGGSWLDPHWKQGDLHPVVCVSYRDAEKFCEWLTRFDANLPSGWRYRLPDDAEWSAACPEGFVWEDERPPHNIANYCGGEAMVGELEGYRNDLAWDARWRDDWPRAAPVGSFKPNPFGLYDMGGNVAEWCATFYQHALNPKEIPENLLPEFDESKVMKPRVVRGASWIVSKTAMLRADYRGCEDPRHRSDDIGFRVVLSDHSADAATSGRK